MGYAQILSGGTNGRYEVFLDYGAETRTTVLAGLADLVIKQQVKIEEAQFAASTADSQEAAQRVLVLAAIDAYVLESQTLPPGSSLPSLATFNFQFKALRQMEAANAGIRMKLTALQAGMLTLRQQTAYWNNFVPTETKGAWCTDFTESASGYVATLDIPGESDLVVIAPGARAWTSDDGIMTAREIQTPAQVFFNAAILPGWQVDKPTYRWGTLSDINWDENTATVSLFAATSSAQALPINQSSTLTAVPFSYMTCNARCFSPDERVVVQFIGQDWAAPQIVGYLDNPRKCPPKFAGTIPDMNTIVDDEDSVYFAELDIYWTGGATPVYYSVATGTLPSGISLDSRFGTFSGTTTDDGVFPVSIRQSDTFYIEGTNRRYDDSNVFNITAVASAWTFYSGSVAHTSATIFHTVDVAIPLVVNYAVSSSVHATQCYIDLATGTDPTPPTPFTWVTGYGLGGFPSLWVRVSIVNSGDLTPTFSGTLNSWIALGSAGGTFGYSSSMFTHAIPPSTTPSTVSIVYTVQYSTDSGGATIVATVTGSFGLTIYDETAEYGP